MPQYLGNGIYRLSAKERLLGSTSRVLPDAMPGAETSYGWLSGDLPLPATGGVYAVEFMNATDVRVLAYLDPFGRCFRMDQATVVPPARRPDLAFASDGSGDGADGGSRLRSGSTGSVLVLDGEDGVTDVARFTFDQGRFTFFDSWYDFGSYGADLSQNDSLTRAFFAFVYRPESGAPKTPERGLDGVISTLRTEKPLQALREITVNALATDDDPLLRTPPIVRCLATWLSEAGLDQLEALGLPDEAVRLVRTASYANTFYVGIDDEDAEVPASLVWGVEGALNRFLLVSEALGQRAAVASEAECLHWDARLVDTAAVQRPAMAGDNMPEGPAGGEWAVRCAIAAAVERLRLPLRISVAMRADLEAGLVALDVTTPNAQLMPARPWNAGTLEAPLRLSDVEREQAALRYALHLGLLLASVAFEAAPVVERVELVLRPLADDGEEDADGTTPETSPRAFCAVTLDRAAWQASNGFEAARADDPVATYQQAGARFSPELPSDEIFDIVKALPAYERRKDTPEALPAPDAPGLDQALGLAGDPWAIRITYDGVHRRFAEGLADAIVRAQSASDAIHIVLAAQEEATARDDDRSVAACTRLMAALAEGTVDATDQNAIVGCFLGEDRCLVALGRAKALAEAGEMDQAVAVLIDAVAEGAALDGFVDGATTVHRTFDSYASRLVYNLARAGALVYPESARADADKRVELAPDSYYLCCLEIVRLLEHSFERTDDAVRFGLRAIELGPTTGAGYRQLGRAYMLVGDMENAAKVLEAGLRIMVQPNDIAMAYYQLAYVLWKMGRPVEGSLCYVKSIITSPLVAMQSSAELQELVEETDVPLPPREGVDEAMQELGLVVAPTAEVLDALDVGTVAATDAGLFPVARNLLAIRLRYRLDDALVSVLHSLEE